MPFTADPDRLSPLGAEQARCLGAYWAGAGVRFDRCYSGPLLRQRQSAEQCGLGPFEVLPELEEYRLGTLLSGAPDNNRDFQRMLEAAVQRWLAGETPAGGESWNQFRSRVRGALGRIMEHAGSGRRIAVFTSGGPVAVAVAMALAAPDASAIELNWRVKNCSLTEFVFSRGRFSLDGFNRTPHLSEERLLTFR